MAVFLLWAAGIASVPAGTASPEIPLSERKVLILYSYFASTPAYVAMTSPLLSALIDAGVPADNLNQEYLDLGRHADPLYRKYLQDYLKSKYTGIKFDLIVTVHGAAQQFVLLDGEALWPRVQLLSLLAPAIPPPKRIGRRTGVMLLSPDFRGTLERALEMFPQTKRVLFVTGSGPPEMKYLEQAKTAFEPWQGKLAFEYTDGQPLEEIVKRVANLPSGTIVLASALITDGSGANLVVAEAIKNVARAANAPVFSFFDSVIGSDVVGGSMVIFDQAGTHAGKLAVDILSGKMPLTDPPSVLPSSPPVPLFDWPQIERWRGDVTRLPENSVFLRRPPTLWEQHKTAVVGTLAAILVLTGFVLALLTQLQQRKRAEESLRESEYRWKFALEGAGEGVWDWNVAEGTAYYSRRWKEMLGYSEDEFGNEIDNWEKRLHPEDRKATLAAVRACFDGVEPTYVSEHRLLCKDGSYKWIISRGMVLSRSDDGKPLRMMGTHADIGERKRQEILINEHNTLLKRQKSELEATLGRIKRLEGMLSICMQCKKIRTENNDWHQLEQYIGEHSDAVFSHGLCPECLEQKLKELG